MFYKNASCDSNGRSIDNTRARAGQFLRLMRSIGRLESVQCLGRNQSSILYMSIEMSCSTSMVNV